MPPERQLPQLDIGLVGKEQDGAIAMRFMFDASRLRRDTVEEFAAQVRMLLDQVVADAAIGIEQLMALLADSGRLRRAQQARERATANQDKLRALRARPVRSPSGDD
jgi:hypothetical protein